MSTLPKRNLLLPAFIVIAAAALLMAACGPKDAQAETQEAPPVENPTATPIPLDRAVLVAPADVDAGMLVEAQTVLAELTASAGLEFETRAQVTEADLTPDVKIIVFLSHPDNLGTLAARAGGTQFAAVSPLDWTPPANVTLIRVNENDAAFLAGYAAAILAPNFRVGALLAAESTSVSLAFQNGVHYYCGTCSALINPLNSYPIVSVQSAGSAPEIWQAAFDQLNLNKVNVLYIAKEAMSSQLLAYLSTQDVALIANQLPMEGGQPRWSASIYLDAISPIREIWNDLLSGVGGRIINATYKVSDVQPLTVSDGSVWLSQGKLRLVNNMIELLRQNQINTQAVN